MLKKLKWKFVLVTMGIVLAMLGIIFGLVYHFTKSDLENSSNNILQRLTQSAGQPNGLREPPRDVQLPYFVLRVNLYGEIVAGGYTQYDLTDANFLNKMVGAVAEDGKSTGLLADYQLMYSVTRGNYGVVIVYLDISSYNDTLTSLIQSCLIIGVVSILAFFVLSIFLARWMIRPVEKSWEQQRQFVSDASHELKTPLTVIMSNAELLNSPTQDIQDKQALADNISIMSVQMRSLVNGLLELTRADNGQVKKTFEKLNISEIVTETLLPFEPVFFEKGMQLRSQIQPDIYLQGSRYHLRQVLEILLDNAGKYGAKGIVTVCLQRRGRQCLLTVANPGTPIPEEEQDKIFERFYRADKARSRTGSFGLGLSIAKSIVQEHRGRIWAISNPTGNCFCVELPCE